VAGYVVDTRPDPKVCPVVKVRPNLGSHLLGFCSRLVSPKGLFIGSQDASRNLTDLKASNVTHILNVATGIPNAFPEVRISGPTPTRLQITSSSLSNLPITTLRCWMCPKRTSALNSPTPFSSWTKPSNPALACLFIGILFISAFISSY